MPTEPFRLRPPYNVTPAHYMEAAVMVYVIKRDDTLTAIARRFGTTVAAILAAN